MSGLDFILRQTPRATDPAPAFKDAPFIGAEDDAQTEETEAPSGRYILEPYFTMIEYTDSNGTTTRRRITMRYIEERGASRTLVAVCHERSAVRRFRLDRISCLISQDGEIEDAAPWFAETLAQSEFIQIEQTAGRTATAPRPAAPKISPYTQLRRAISPALTVLIASARSDDYLHPRERDRILRYCEDEAVALRKAGALKAFLDADDFDKLDRTIQPLRPTQDEVVAAFGAVAELGVARMKHLAKALADTAHADGRVDDLEQILMDSLVRFGTSLHGFGWNE